MHKIGLLAKINHTCASKPPENLSLILLYDSLGLKDFLLNNQIIYLNKDNELVSTLWIQSNSLLTENEFKTNVIRSWRPGFKGHHVFLFKGANIPKQWIDLEHHHHLIIKQTNNLFLYHSGNNG
ncbi:MAG: hypothetical protein HQK76_20390 [Desulfobacterales bacterium]|nr:hypothetical protein [Desulfobacterales bacterium]